jgi:hypothetical protein
MGIGSVLGILFLTLIITGMFIANAVLWSYVTPNGQINNGTITKGLITTMIAFNSILAILTFFGGIIIAYNMNAQETFFKNQLGRAREYIRDSKFPFVRRSKCRDIVDAEDIVNENERLERIRNAPNLMPVRPRIENIKFFDENE